MVNTKRIELKLLSHNPSTLLAHMFLKIQFTLLILKGKFSC